VSWPVGWDEVDDIRPSELTIRTVLGRLTDGDPWSEAMPRPQRLSAALIEEGNAIPSGRVLAMHEGKRRARERRQ
jgi:DNA primase